MAPRRRALLLAAAFAACAPGLAGCPADLGRCGDGTVDPGEQCDDGNQTDGDGCSRSCRWSGTDEDGDGVRTPADCNDRLASVHPGAPEIACDGVDNDCAPETPDCPDGDAASPAPDAATAPDAAVDAAAPAPDACVVRPETCANCLDENCDGHDDVCDADVRIDLAPLRPAAGADVTVVASSTTAYTWVLLAHEAPDGHTDWIGCPDCNGQSGGRFTWTYTLTNLAAGRHLVTFGRDYENDDPAVGTRLVCAAIETQ